MPRKAASACYSAPREEIETGYFLRISHPLFSHLPFSLTPGQVVSRIWAWRAPSLLGMHQAPFWSGVLEL
jgi:hypothetical protein